MLRTPSIFGPLNSGFVPLSPAAPHASPVDDRDVVEGADVGVAGAESETAEVIARAAAPAVGDTMPFASVVPWQPRSTMHVRVVEGAVIAAMCGFFGWGLLRTLAGS